jgi:23S rRNA-/tRNA-specific pseudouridylate synthase
MRAQKITSSSTLISCFYSVFYLLFIILSSSITTIHGFVGGEYSSLYTSHHHHAQQLKKFHPSWSHSSVSSSAAATPPEGIIDTRQWQILQPSIRLCHNVTTDETSEIILGNENTELPFLSGLLFVNKPSGMSTLPTKQQLDNPTVCPQFPCLSDSVNEWLQTDPKGKELLEKAQLEEEQWWDNIVLRVTPQNSKERRHLKKRIRQREKQVDKLSTFMPRPAHRLDIDTSGIVCIALTPNALRVANMLFEQKSLSSGVSGGDSEKVVEEEGGMITKRYVALVEGYIDKDASTGVISHAIGKVWVDDHNEWACDVTGDGNAFIRHNDNSSETSKFQEGSLREAVTSYKAIDWSTVQTRNGDVNKNVTRVELFPHTGRGHQLRLHMAALRYPIVGDDMHGDKLTLNRQARLCLHALELSMDVFCFDEDNSPLQKCRIVVESPPPF